ncbi:hypothetical protein ACFU6R_11370 [Streptomyces sp. NPDC057499]
MASGDIDESERAVSLVFVTVAEPAVGQPVPGPTVLDEQLQVPP